MSLNRSHRIPRAAVITDTVIAVFLCGVGAYHFTQPHQAWRSGIIEVASAALLIAAAYLVDRIKSMIIQVVIAATIGALGIRHLALGGGWRSGCAEVSLAIVLVAVAVTIYRDKPANG